jgi:hypothetical protein
MSGLLLFECLPDHCAKDFSALDPVAGGQTINAVSGCSVNVGAQPDGRALRDG